MKILKKALTIIASVILWGIILLAALFAFTTLATRDQTQVASLAGFTPMVVETDSMAPTFRAGDLIMIRKCDPAELKEGDIICFHTIIQNEYALNTHRINKIDDMNGVRSYETKGDNNAISDSHIISDGDIVGKYVGKVSGLGKVMDFLSSSMGFLIVIVLPMFFFFIYQVYHLVMVTISLKKAVAAEEAARIAEEEMDRMSHPVPPQGMPIQQPSPGPQGMPMRQSAPGLQGMPVQQPAAGSQIPPMQPAREPDPLAEEKAETDAILAEAQKIRAEAEAAKARAEAETALAEAKRMKAEAEAELAKIKAAKEEEE